MDDILDIYELSRKYVVAIMRATCVEILKDFFPNTLGPYQHTIRKRATLVSFRASLRCVVTATTDSIPTLLPACYLYIAARYYDEMLDIRQAASWPPEIPLTVYATIVRSMRQISHLKREVIDNSFSDNWADGWGLKPHDHQIAELLTYYRGPNHAGIFPEEDLSLFNPIWMATAVVASIGSFDLCEECIACWDNAQRESWVTAWHLLPTYLMLGGWHAMQQEEEKASSTA